MIVVDIGKPRTCAECLMNCKTPSNKILCRNDMQEHIAMDEGCLIKSEITESTYKMMCCCCMSDKDKEND